MDIKNYLLDYYIKTNGKTLSPEIAKEIVMEMAVTDGTDRPDGEKWNYDEAIELGSNMGVNWANVNKCEWYTVLNMMYSDHYTTAKRHSLIDPVFFGELALDWFNDVDAEKDKTFKYFFS